MKKYDSIIIGAGQAGPALATSLAGKGENVLLIERDKLGGTCVNTGCTPTKALVASARVAHQVRRSADFGIITEGNMKVDMKRVYKRMKEIVDSSREGLGEWIKGTSTLDLIMGHARFTSEYTLQVGENSFTAPKIFINTGGRPRIPEGVKDTNYLTNSSVLELQSLPDHLIIVGGSYIGLEFAQIYRRFGSRVTVVEKGDRLIHKEDPQVSSVVKDFLEDEGVEFRLSAECISASQNGKNIQVEVNCKEGAPRIEGSHVLMATGRIPNTDDLGLENTKVERTSHGFLKVNERLQTTAENIWGLGDCTGHPAFTHAAYNDYEIVFDHLYGASKRKVSDRIPCYALYTDPPLARIGMSSGEAKESNRSVLVGEMPMSKVARAKEKSEVTGFMQALIDEKTGKILGATILGTGGDEVIHSLLDCMYADASYDVISQAVHIHPTVSELIPTMLQSLKPLGKS